MPRKIFSHTLVALCFMVSACEGGSLRHAKTYSHPTSFDGVPSRTKLMIVKEDAPVADSMLSWREKASNLISFTKGEKEKAEAIARIQSYPNPAEIAEEKSAPIITSALNLDKEPVMLTFKGKDKTFDVAKIKLQNPDVAYLLDYNIDEWALKPNPSNKSRFWLDIDMEMRVTDVEKGTVLVQQKCYFADGKNAFSQYELFSEDAKLLKKQIRTKALQCAKQINKTLGQSLTPQS